MQRKFEVETYSSRIVPASSLKVQVFDFTVGSLSSTLMVNSPQPYDVDPAQNASVKSMAPSGRLTSLNWYVYSFVAYGAGGADGTRVDGLPTYHTFTGGAFNINITAPYATNENIVKESIDVCNLSLEGNCITR